MPSRAETNLRGRLLNLYEEAKQDKGRWTGTWQTNWSFYRGKQAPDVPSWMNTPRFNFIQTKIQTIVPILTDNRPRIHTLPRTPDLSEYADVMQKKTDWWWDETGMDRTIEVGSIDSLIFGAGFYMPCWDPFEDRAIVKNVTPQALFVNPGATSLSTARCVIHVDEMPLYELMTRFPEAKDKLKTIARTVEEDKRWSGQDSDRDPISVSYTPGAVSELVPGNLGVASAADDTPIQVLQYWIRDPATIIEELSGSNGVIKDSAGNKVLVELAKYPKGRHIVIAGNTIIHDDGNPYHHGEFPYVMQACYPTSNEFWPIGLVDMLISPQKVVNKLYGQILDNAALMANPQWLLPKEANVDPEMLTGEPGLVIEYDNVERDAKPDRVEGMSLPAFVFEALRMAFQVLDDTSGVHDVTQGKKPAGIQSGVALDQLNEHVQTRLRLLVRHMERAIEQMGQQVIALDQQYVTESRTIRIVNEATGTYEFVEMTPEMIQGQWDIMVAAGSTLPRSREMLRAEAVEFLQLGLFDRQAALEHMGTPGAEKILQRLKAEDRRRMALMQGGQNGQTPFRPEQQSRADLRRPQVQGRGQGFLGLES